jgi:cysteine sulfinate desulfinase/cysteine desulfurase-like protein
LIEMGLSEEDARSSIRLSLGHSNTEEEVERAAAILLDVVETGRRSAASSGSPHGRRGVS